VTDKLPNTVTRKFHIGQTSRTGLGKDSISVLGLSPRGPFPPHATLPWSPSFGCPIQARLSWCHLASRNANKTLLPVVRLLPNLPQCCGLIVYVLRNTPGSSYSLSLCNRGTPKNNFALSCSKPAPCLSRKHTLRFRRFSAAAISSARRRPGDRDRV